jgi:thiamine biosynthesis lipoprotein
MVSCASSADIVTFTSQDNKVGALVLALAAAACTQGPPQPRLVERTRIAMGSSLSVTAWTADEPAASAAFDAVFAEFDRLDRLLSVWKPGSDVLRLNDAAGRAPVPVSPETREVLTAAHQASEWSHGKFDITFGALSDVWKFDHDQDNRVPSPEEIHARLPLIDYRQVEVDDGRGEAFIRRPGMRVHLGGIGKGYAVDRAVAILRHRGLRDFMIQSGGDMYVAGRRGDRPWRLGINDPRGPDGDSFATIELSDETLSTSGDYERFFIKDGVRYHHIIDPSTGQPSRLCRSVTIVTDRALVADALSTAIFLLGPVEGLELAERLGVGAVIVSANNELVVSSRLKGRLTRVHTPRE